MQFSEEARKNAIEWALARRGDGSKKVLVRASLTNQDRVLCVPLKSMVCACVCLSADNTVLVASRVLCQWILSASDAQKLYKAVGVRAKMVSGIYWSTGPR